MPSGRGRARAVLGVVVRHDSRVAFENVLEIAVAQRRVREERANELGDGGWFEVDEMAVVEEEEDVGL